METNINYKYSIIDEEILQINSKELKFYVTDYYDGLKEEANLDENILLLWNNYDETYETWFQIESIDINYLKKYLSNEIGILTLMKNSNIKLVKRYYKTYDSFNEPKEISFDSKLIQFPEDDIFIGQNLLKFINNDINYERVLKIKKEFSTLSTKATVKPIKNCNSVNFKVFGIAA